MRRQTILVLLESFLALRPLDHSRRILAWRNLSVGDKLETRAQLVLVLFH